MKLSISAFGRLLVLKHVFRNNNPVPPALLVIDNETVHTVSFAIVHTL